MSTLGEGENREFWIDYLQKVKSDSNLQASTYTIASWCQEIGNPNSFESPNNIKEGLTSCWNLWIQDLHADYPELYQFLNQEKFFLNGTLFLRKINIFTIITHGNIFRTNNKFPFKNTFANFNNIIAASLCILRNKFRDRSGQRSWLTRTLDSSSTVKKITNNLVKNINPTITQNRNSQSQTE